MTESTPSSVQPTSTTFAPHGFTYNCYPCSVSSTNMDYLFNPFELPHVYTFAPTASGSTYSSVPDTYTFHAWLIDNSMLDLALYRFVAPNPPRSNLLLKVLDSTKHLHKRYFLALPGCYFLIYQLVLHSSINHLFYLQACVCHTLDCDVPPHNHSKNNLCQRIFFTA